MALVATSYAGPRTEDILARYWERRRSLDPRLSRHLELKDAVEDRMYIPLPEQSKTEKPLVANLLASGLYGYAERSASVLPDVRCPPAREGDFDVHLKRANARRNAIKGWWAMNRLELGLVQRFLYFYAYACAPAVIRPRPPNRSRRMRDIPYWHLRDPLSTLPPPGGEIDPPDCIFTFKRTLAWLSRSYPDAARALQRPRDASPDTLLECVEYLDDECSVLVVLGQTADRYETNGHNSYIPGQGGPLTGSLPWVEVERAPNAAHICPVVIPGRICLDERMGQFTGLVGSQWWAGRLMALATNAAQEDVYPSVWTVSPAGTPQAEIITPADGPKGVVGQLSPGADIKAAHAPPGAASFMVIDRITESIRNTGGIPSDWQGMSGDNIRTARRGGQVLSSTVDFPMATAQKVMATALEEENVRAVAVVKASYSGTKSFYFTWNGRGAYADYDIAETFDTDANEVRYPFPGTNINDTVIGAGQRVGMGSLSKRSWMDMDPMVEDPEAEYGRVTSEALESALLQGLQQQIAGGTIPPADAARITALVSRNGKSLFEAVAQVQAEAQRRQSPTVDPAAPGSPETQPGLAVPGQGAEAATVQPPAQGMTNLSDVLRTLSSTGRSPT